MNKRRVVGWLAMAVALAIVAGVVATMFATDGASRLQPPRRAGPPALVQTPTVASALWLLTRREERRTHWWMDGWETLVHFELHAHDPRTTARRWSRRLLTLRDGGHAATGRILGIEGDVVWLFLHDQPVATSAADGRVLAIGSTLAETNPGLAPMWPTQPASFAFAGGLIVTTADALRWRIAPGTWRASAWRPADDEAFRRAQFMSTQWNGGWRTTEFLTRHLRAPDGRWIGLYSDREAADAANDPWGRHHAEPDAVHDEGALARRSFRVASIGRTRVFSEGAHDRLTALAPAGGSGVYLQGGLLKVPGQRLAMQPGVAGSSLVVHRNRTDALGSLVLTHVEPTFAERWRVALPIQELNNRWELDGSLLLVGSSARPVDGRPQHEEHLVAIDLRDGRLRHWSVERDGAE